MQNKINISELLRDCPQGMELDCTMYEDVYFDYVDELNIIHCYIQRECNRTSITFNQHGTIGSDIKSKCVIFPKGKITWKGFHRPFKDGDVIYNNDINALAIFYKQTDSSTISYCFLNVLGELGVHHYHSKDLSDWNFATEEEKARLFKTIKDNGYRWNPETKTLEELPIFKVGDRIRHKDNRICCTLGEYSEGISAYRTNIGLSITHKDLKQWELVQNKFDITTLKPFDKVLVRDCNEDKWKIDFFSDYNNDGTYQCMTFTKNQCIPYKGNEHLRNTTNSCDDYFKTWNDE